jgi:hypothetical protein
VSDHPLDTERVCAVCGKARRVSGLFAHVDRFECDSHTDTERHLAERLDRLEAMLERVRGAICTCADCYRDRDMHAEGCPALEIEE